MIKIASDLMKNLWICFNEISVAMNNFINFMSKILLYFFIFFAFSWLVRSYLVFILLYLGLYLFKLVRISLNGFKFLLLLFIKFSIKFFIFGSKLIIDSLICLDSSFSFSMKIYLLLLKLIRTCLQNWIKVNI